VHFFCCLQCKNLIGEFVSTLYGLILLLTQFQITLRKWKSAGDEKIHDPTTTLQCHNPEDLNLKHHCCESLKTCKCMTVTIVATHANTRVWAPANMCVRVRLHTHPPPLTRPPGVAGRGGRPPPPPPPTAKPSVTDCKDCQAIPQKLTVTGETCLSTIRARKFWKSNIFTWITCNRRPTAKNQSNTGCLAQPTSLSQLAHWPEKNWT
jgi:hypothetical protein